MAEQRLINKDIENTKTAGSYAVFTKTAPAKLHYCIDINDKIDEGYLKMYHSRHWDYVCDFNSLHVFVSDDINTVQLQSNEYIKNILVKSVVYKKELSRLTKIALFIHYLLYLYP